MVFIIIFNRYLIKNSIKLYKPNRIMNKVYMRFEHVAAGWWLQTGLCFGFNSVHRGLCAVEYYFGLSIWRRYIPVVIVLNCEQICIQLCHDACKIFLSCHHLFGRNFNNGSDLVVQSSWKIFDATFVPQFATSKLLAKFLMPNLDIDILTFGPTCLCWQSVWPDRTIFIWATF